MQTNCHMFLSNMQTIYVSQMEMLTMDKTEKDRRININLNNHCHKGTIKRLRKQKDSFLRDINIELHEKEMK